MKRNDDYRLEKDTHSNGGFAAALAEDPVERMKYVMLCSVAFIGNCHSFDKPLNPILGETYEGSLPDGSHVYME